MTTALWAKARWRNRRLRARVPFGRVQHGRTLSSAWCGAVAFVAIAFLPAERAQAQTAGERVSARVEMDTGSMLSSARLAALPDSLRHVWEAYVARSRAQQDSDRASMARELKRVGRDTMIRAPYVTAFAVTPAMTDSWFASDSARRIADIMLSFQTPSGGWSKHVDLTQQPRQPGQSYFSENVHWQYIATIDNGSTTEQLTFLERATTARASARNAAAHHRGLAYLFEAQFPNGCWPQVFPLQGGYHDAATYNDDATLNVLRLFERVAAGQVSLASANERRVATDRVKRGLSCLLDSQVIVDGQRTVWGQQHDPLTLLPVAARSYELRSLVSKESATIALFLMHRPKPDARTIAAVHAAAAWFKANAITGFAYNATNGFRARAGAGPLWARLSEIGTNRPIFSNRAGITLYDWNELTDRRQGYAWYSDEPVAALKAYDVWARTHPLVAAHD